MVASRGDRGRAVRGRGSPYEDTKSRLIGETSSTTSFPHSAMSALVCRIHPALPGVGLWSAVRLCVLTR